MTDEKVYAQLFFSKNGNVIGRLFFSVTAGNSYQTSTFVILQYLDKNDTLYLEPYSSMRIFGGTYSCISFLQLTNG